MGTNLHRGGDDRRDIGEEPAAIPISGSVLVPASTLYLHGILWQERHLGTHWDDIGEAIVAGGWDADPLPLIMRPGTQPVLDDGNHRVAWLHFRGHGATLVPVRFVWL